ncbi:Pantothenate kinase [Candidatus Providencia siddallii]|uniref:Pantothenate kinase n=1 Tax=Candidatus Providencia siddallii TaxID=1715285 RepID=A0A0M6W7K8_9GAMM|nr:Pantothenate kinase [Candidatus Providencia siddallii]
MKQKNIFFTKAYIEFSRKRWSELRDFTKLQITPNEVFMLKGINEELSINDVIEIYFPLSCLLNFCINHTKNSKSVFKNFLGSNFYKKPYLIGIAGSVAVGKSTTARVLQFLLTNDSKSRKVDLITTDGFLHSNKMLNDKKIMNKKGFPQSYDISNLIEFVSQIKSGVRNITIPVYSHLTYDIVPNKVQLVDQPDILILEGLNVLQTIKDYIYKPYHSMFVSDFIDFSIYVDADPQLLRQWYINRFLKFRSSSFLDPKSYFYCYSKLTEKEAVNIAGLIWDKINGLNLKENILPTKERANLIIIKGKDHSIQNIHLKNN